MKARLVDDKTVTVGNLSFTFAKTSEAVNFYILLATTASVDKIDAHVPRQATWSPKPSVVGSIPTASANS